MRPGTRVVVVGRRPGRLRGRARGRAARRRRHRRRAGGARRLGGAHRRRAVQDPDRHRRGDDARRRRARAGRAVPRRRRRRTRPAARSRRPRPGQRAGARARRRAVARTCTGGSRPEGVRIVRGTGRLRRPRARATSSRTTARPELSRPTSSCVATGAHPRAARRRPDGERILSWTQLYDLDRRSRSGSSSSGRASPAPSSPPPTTLSASTSCWSPAATACSPARTRDAAEVIEDVFRRRGMTVLSRSRAASVKRDRRRRRGDPRRRPDRRGLALPDGGRVDPEHRGPRAGGGRRAADDVRPRRGRPGLAHVRARGLRGRRLHRRAAARVGRGDAGPDRDVARARRRRHPARAADGVGQHLHRARDRHRRLDRRRRSSAARRRARWSSSRWPATPAPRCRASTTAS